MALEAEVRAKGAAKLAALSVEQDQAQSWIEALLGKPFESPFADELKDGNVLCQVINAIKPGSIKKISTSKLAFKQMENISAFLKKAKTMGLQDKDVFDTIDLYEARDLCKVIMCIHAFGAVVHQNAGSTGFNGPFLETSVKYAASNERVFTEEQLAKQREMAAGGTKMTSGSSDVMQRSEIQKTGITFGNDKSGAGSAEISAISAGSAGIMERSGVQKTGITFGNDQAGAGSGEMSAVSAGSAGIMERSGVQKTGITFGNDQAGAGSGEMSAISAGSAGIMERSGVQKTGITFGNDQAGAGSGEMSAVSAGSAGIMERSGVQKTGITFGNDQAGAGSGGMTATSAGSAGVMDRSEVSTANDITFGSK